MLQLLKKMDKKHIWFLSGKVLWEGKVEGSIGKINVNKKGYVSIITEGTSYKSVIITYDKSGKELFKTYLASTIAIDAEVSNDAKYLAIAEINIGGALIESGIKIVEIESASNGDTTNSVIFRYNADANNVITDIKYQDKDQLVCIYDNSIHIIYNDEDKVISNFDSNVQMADINLKNSIVRTEEESSGLLSVKTNVILTNINSNSDIVYPVDSVIKQLICCDNVVAVNLGTEVHLFNLNGWLEKRYTSSQEIKDIALGSSIAGIIYHDRIKILSF